MSISVTISGADYEEFRAKFDWMAGWFGYIRMETPTQPDLFPATDKVGAEAAAAEPPKTPRGRKKTEPEAAAAAAAPAPATEQKVYSLEEAKEAGHLVIAARGTQALRDLLTEFGVQRIAELHKDKVGPFVIRCKQLTGA